MGVKDSIDELSQPKYRQLGNQASWSVMADWNPAEIIGLTPSPLAFDLYKAIVTDEIWAKQRHEVGYRDIRGWPLIRTFGGQAFVDVRASLNSFIPMKTPKNVAESIVNYATKLLNDDPSLHDKIEFELIPTCIDFNFDKWETTYRANGVVKPEQLMVYKEELRKVTVNIIDKVDGEVDKAEQLEVESINHIEMNVPVSDWLRNTLRVCSQEGALCFAHLARAGFVAAALLKFSSSSWPDRRKTATSTHGKHSWYWYGIHRICERCARWKAFKT